MSNDKKANQIKVGQRIIVRSRVATVERIMVLHSGNLRIYHSRGQFDCKKDDTVLTYEESWVYLTITKLTKSMV